MKVTTWINITAMENGDKPSGWRFSTWLLQNLIQTLRKDGFFPKFLTGFQLGLGQLWPHLWCGILDTLVQKSTGECCKIPQAREEQSRNPSYPSLWQMFSPLLQSYLFLLFFVHRRVIQRLHSPCSGLVMEALCIGKAIWVWGSWEMLFSATSSAEGSSIPPSSTWVWWGIDPSSLWWWPALAAEMRRGLNLQWVLRIPSTLGTARNLKVWLLIQDFSGTRSFSACRDDDNLESKKCKREEVAIQGHFIPQPVGSHALPTSN